MSPAWSCFAVLAMLVVYSRCTREQLDRHIATIRTTATSKEMRGTPVTAVGEAPPKVSETPDAVEIEGRTSYFSRVSPRRIENIDKFSDRDPPIESTTSTTTTTTEDISVLYSLYGAPAPGILLSKEEVAAESYKTAMIVPSPFEGPARLRPLTSLLQEAINDFTYGSIQDTIHGITKTLKRPESVPRIYV